MWNTEVSRAWSMKVEVAESPLRVRSMERIQGLEPITPTRVSDRDAVPASLLCVFVSLW
jgi:hypothetical protein